MKRISAFRSTLQCLVTCALLMVVPICQAQQSPVHLDRHAKKIQKLLTACPAGSHVHLTLRDQTDQFGYLGSLSSQSFELLDPKTRAPQVLAYDQIDNVGCENRGSEVGFHHHRNSTGFLIIIGVAVGVSVAILAASRN
jgi:hypothetical protein